MKTTLITVCYRSANVLATTLESVARQILPPGRELEYLVVDGASDDGTADLLRSYEKRFAQAERISFRWLSEPDRGMYDALNKGLARATGEIVGIVNADDVLAADDTIARIAASFSDGTDLVYGDVRFVRPKPGAAETCDALRALPSARYCTGRFFRPWMFRFATFPAHPSTFVRRACFARCGAYSLDYRICADFEMMLRLIAVYRVTTRYVPLCTTVMRTGGMSTAGFASNRAINREDLRALRAHGFRSCMFFLYLKYLFKIWGILLPKGAALLRRPFAGTRRSPA